MIWTVQQLAIFAWFVASAASTVRRALVVRARAGTGKTTSIFEAVAQYVKAAVALGKRPAVLICAFSKEIADEATHRVNKFGMGEHVTARTLHSLGCVFIGKALGKRKPRQVEYGDKRAWYLATRIAPQASEDALELISNLNHKAREILPLATCGADLAKLAQKFDCVPDGDLEREGWTLDAVCNAAFDCMKLGAHDFTSMDFADMIFWPLVNNWVRPMYDFTVVDEAQDMTEAQLELALRATHKTGHVVIVGDDRQAIYDFRGADSGSLDRLKGVLNADELGLTVTYRCPRKVVDMAKVYVPDYTAHPDAPEGTIAEVACTDKMLEMVKPGDFILSRTNAPLASLCLSLIREGVRAFIRGRDIGKGLVSIIKRQNATDVADLEMKIRAWRDREAAAVIKKLGEKSGAEPAALIADKAEVIIALCDGCLSVAEVVARIKSMFQEKASVPSVMLSTVHRAKGLESENVYSLEWTFKRKGGEEDNIRYVDLTRTKSCLYLVSERADRAKAAA